MNYFIDFEATQYSNEIISIGCVNENGEEFASLVKPSQKITPFITELTGLTDAILQEAPLPDQVFSEFFNWCNISSHNTIPVFYCYGNADINFVKKNFNNSQNFKAKSILSYLYTDLFDYEPIVRKHFGIIQAVGVAKVYNYYKNEENIQKHDALEDARMLKYVYEQIQAHTEQEDEEAFPEYKVQQTTPSEQIEYFVHRMKNGNVIETYDSLREAAAWVYSELPKETQKAAEKKNIIKKIKHSNSTHSKYFNYRWKLERKR